MKTKDLKINFRYLGGNIACLSVDSIDGKSIHNDINNEEAIIIFNSLVGEKENCQTVKKLLQENQELKEKLDKYENPKDLTLFAMWCTEKVKDENQELKLELSGYRQAILNNKEMLGLKEQNDKLKKKYENAVADYEITMFEKEQLNSLVNSCQEEIRQLKKQLKPNYYVKGLEGTLKEYQQEMKKVAIQQKEFIKYLEDEINKWNYNYDSYNYEYEVEEPTAEELANKILQKYKEIIGDE